MEQRLAVLVLSSAACTAAPKRHWRFEGGATVELTARRSTPARSANHNKPVGVSADDDLPGRDAVRRACTTWLEPENTRAELRDH